MPDAATFAAFLAAVLAMQAVPGPDTMLVVSRGIGQGRRLAFWTVLGMTLAAGAIQLPLLALGVASVVRSSPLAFEVLRWMGAAYLLWLGAGLLLGRGRGAAPAAGLVPAKAPSSATQKATGLVVLGATALAAGAVGGLLARRPGLVAWQERFAGAVMAVLGLHLLVSGARAGR